MRYVIVITLIVLISCKAQQDVKSTSTENAEFELIAFDAFSGITEYEAAMIYDAKSLQKFYSRINKTRKPGLPVPQIDFLQNMLLAVCLGEQKGEAKPLVEKSEEDDNILIAIGLGESKGEEPAQERTTSYPFYLYKLLHTSKSVKIQKTEF